MGLVPFKSAVLLHESCHLHDARCRARLYRAHFVHCAAWQNTQVQHEVALTPVARRAVEQNDPSATDALDTAN